MIFDWDLDIILKNTTLFFILTNINYNTTIFCVLISYLCDLVIRLLHGENHMV